MRSFSLAYLTVNASSILESIDIAEDLGFDRVGLRLRPNTPGAPCQTFINHPEIQHLVLARLKDSPVEVFDIEIVRLAEDFEATNYTALFDAGAALGAQAVLVAADDTQASRLSENYAQLCEFIRPYGMSADLEFMAWTGVKDALSAWWVIEQAGSPTNAGLLFDALHFGRSSSELSDIAKIPTRLLHYAQICDAQAGRHFSTEELIQTARQERLLPGEGTIDIQGLFGALPQDMPVSVEIPNFKRSSVLGDRDWAAQCLKASEAVLNSVHRIQG
jgi:sugar phosphate isomerase/epimerase